MKDILTRLFGAVVTLLRWIVAFIGLVLTIQMIGDERLWTALTLFIGTLVMFPPTGRRVIGAFRRPWIGLAGAGLLMFAVAPVIAVFEAPTAEELAAREQRAAVARAESAARKAAEEKERLVADARKAEERLRKKCTDEVSAFVMSQSFVKDRLRAPATADFPSILDAKVSVTGKCQFRVHSYVDAQNGFGALIRTRYTADLEVDPATDRWRLKNIQMQ